MVIFIEVNYPNKFQFIQVKPCPSLVRKTTLYSIRANENCKKKARNGSLQTNALTDKGKNKYTKIV